MASKDRGLTPIELSGFCSEIALMLGAGMPLYAGMEALEKTYEQDAHADLYHKVSETLTQTGSLRDALEETHAFPTYLVEMCGIGERTGHLEDVMQGLSAYYERESRIRQAVRSAVTYPLVLSVMMVLILLVLILKVMPVFRRVLGSMGVTMTETGSVMMSVGTALGWVVLALVLGLASNYISVATGTLTEIGTVRTEYTPVAVYVRTDDPASALEDTKGYTFGILESLDRESTDSAVSQITERFGSAVTTKTYAGITQLIDGLLNKECGAIILNTAYIDVVTELDKYADVESKIRELEVLHVETAVQSEAEKTQSTGNSDAENRIYTLYISGSDTRQGLNTVGRSDVNILATINTETRQILLVTTPRDYYVPLPVSGGIPDKLTHAGIYGVNVSIGTLEMLYDTDIDYYFRLNFSGFTGIVDALGGITVDNAFTKDNYTYPVGKVQMDGKMALTFARERYSFVDGDIQRGKNQLKVISAIIDKALSPDILVRYNSIMDSIKDCFEMDVPYDDIAALVRRQLSDNGSWNVVQCSVTGTGDSQIPYSMSDYAYVMRPDYNTVNKAKELMQAVKDGKTLSKTDTNITDADRTRYASMPGDPAASYTSSGSGTQSSSGNNYSYSDSNDYSYSGGSDNSGYEEPSVPSEPSGGDETPAEPDPGTNGGETIAEPAA